MTDDDRRTARLGRAIELTPEHPLDDVVDLARTAESTGFEAALVSCHHFNRDPFVAAARVGAATDLRVGPAATNPYETHPVALAARAGTLQEGTDGRAVFGVAPGDRSALSNLGIEPDRPLRRTLESFRVARRLWAGDRVDHDGTFEASDAGLTFSVDPLPVYVGAQGPDMIRMSAKHADGVLLNASHPDDFAWAANRVEEGLADRPEKYGPFDFGAFASVSVAEDGAVAREAARPPVAFIAGGAAPPVLDRHDIDREAAEAVGEALSAGELQTAFDQVTPEMIAAFSVAGTPETVADRLAAVGEYTDSVVVGSPLGPDLEMGVELAGTALDGVLD
jgi:5,10-methylenetetrahydromethanopterin reductase